MLKFVGVSKFYDEKEALSNISFELDKGDFLFIVGPSGAGKTTILKLIHKEIEPSRGEIFFNNDSLKKYSGKVYLLRRKISMIFQDYKLFKRKTVYENVSFPLEIQGFSPQLIKSRVLDTLKMVGLEEQIYKYPNTLSGGEMQRVSIARAIVNNPDILIADEPTGNLDWKTSFNIVDLFVKINENGTTVIMSTHNEEIIKKYNKRILYIKDGKKLYEKYPNIA
ncbi:MAG TPA: ATP-binding cassette domain-containing protein [Caldisericia bacterium]|nr:ATP-binding cassette domain-containing protein [Caldisericia bacterium]